MAKQRTCPKTVVFFGPDGAGKTTQARLLVAYFKSKGCPTSHAWIRARHSIAFLLSEFFTKIGYYQLQKVPSGTIYKVVDRNLLQKMLKTWTLIEFASVLPWIITRVYIPKITGRTVVAERFTVDTVVYLDYLLNHNYSKSYTAKILINLIPKKSVLIHFDAETSTLTKRLRFDTTTLDFITFQREKYDTFARLLKATTINTTNYGIKDAYQKIVETIELSAAT